MLTRAGISREDKAVKGRLLAGEVSRVALSGIDGNNSRTKTSITTFASSLVSVLRMITSNTETTKHLTLPNTFCFAVLAALALVMSGCRSQQATVKAADPAGVYALVSVDGKQVPVNTSHEGTILQVRSGTFTINADGTCSTKTIFVPPSGAEVTREVNATYTKDGSKLNMQWKGAGKTAGTILDDTFTMNNEGMIFVYRK